MRKNVTLVLLFLFINITFGFAQKTHHWETAIFKNDTWKYFIGTTDPGINTTPNWRSLAFTDTGWLTGK